MLFKKNHLKSQIVQDVVFVGLLSSKRIHRSICLLIGLLVAGASGGFALAQGWPVFDVTTKDPGDRVTVTMVGTRAEVDVFSKKGIGTANVERVSGGRPSGLVLRLRLEGLEELRFTYGGRTVRLSAPRSQESPVLESIITAAGEQPIEPGSSYWMAVERVEADKDAAGKGYFLVTGPQDFLNASRWAFSISWIDFYR